MRAQTASQYAAQLHNELGAHLEDSTLAPIERFTYASVMGHVAMQIEALQAAEKQQRAEAVERVIETWLSSGVADRMQYVRNPTYKAHVDTSASVAVDVCFGREAEA